MNSAFSHNPENKKRSNPILTAVERPLVLDYAKAVDSAVANVKAFVNVYTPKPVSNQLGEQALESIKFDREVKNNIVPLPDRGLTTESGQQAFTEKEAA